MGEIVILESIVDSAFESESEPFVLFGDTGYVDPKLSKTFDFIFYCIRGIPIENLKKDDKLLTIPLLSGKNIRNKECYVYENYQKNKALNLFALRNYDTVLLHSNIPRIVTKSLDFYSVQEYVKIGNRFITQIKEIEICSVVSDSALENSFKNWGAVAEHLNNLKEEINRTYQAAYGST